MNQTTSATTDDPITHLPDEMFDLEGHGGDPNDVVKVGYRPADFITTTENPSSSQDLNNLKYRRDPQQTGEKDTFPPPSNKNCNKLYIGIALVLLLIVAGIGAGVAIAVGGGSDDDNNEPTASPTSLTASTPAAPTDTAPAAPSIASPTTSAEPTELPYTEIAKILSFESNQVSSFGTAISIDSISRTLVVGSPDDTDFGTSSGALYIFQEDDLSKEWNRTARLVASDGVPQAQFGKVVTMRNNKLYVGAPGDTGNGFFAGAVYVFERENNVWTELDKLVASDTEPTGDSFGESIAVSEDLTVLVVGAPFDDENGENAGAAYIFELVTGVYTQTAKLRANDAKAGDRFGSSVAISQGTVAIGTEYSAGFGAVYIFEADGGAWVDKGKLTADDATDNDRFGSSISISGDILAVGAFLEDGDGVNGVDSGSVYVFEKSGTWVQTAHLIASDGITEDQFGYSVVVLGTMIAIGAPGFNDDSVDDTGSAYLFEKSDGNWIETKKMAASDVIDDPNDFGDSVAILSDGASPVLVAVGAGNTVHDGRSRGAVYLYEL